MDTQQQDETQANEESKPISVRAENPYLVPGAVLLAGVLIAGAVFYSNTKPPSGSAAIADGYDGTAKVSANIEDDDPALGSPDAPVTLVEFSDFQCPFCGKFFNEAEQKIIQTYVKTGKVKFVYRDFPLSSIHAMAQKAAEAGECAHEQDKFWEYHDMIFRNQEALGTDSLKRWARDAGLDGTQFDQCLDSGKYAKEVRSDAADGQGIGVDSTPSVFINGRIVRGALPFEDYTSQTGQTMQGFDSLIRRALEEAGK